MKKALGATNALYPTPTTLVGATVDGSPNFITVAHIGIMNRATPQYLSVSIAKAHYTGAGIKENLTFSVCLPSRELVVETDYCGITTGKTTDKASLFEVFYGELKTAPMIAQCPVCMECKLDRTVDFPTHDLFIGEIIQTYAEESVLSEGVINIAEVNPLLFDMNSRNYWSLGEPVGDCWSIGKQLKRK